MKTIRRLLYKEILSAVVFVALGFLALFFFFDFVDELRDIGKPGSANYDMLRLFLVVTLMVPSHLYELLPIAVLIGTIFVMARLAQSSEYTILRTSGLGPWRALQTLLIMALGFVVLTFAVGDYLAPTTDRASQLVKAPFVGAISIGQTGAWLKEKQGNNSSAVNVGSLKAGRTMESIRIFEFDERGRLNASVQAASGTFAPDSKGWDLTNVRRTVFDTANSEQASVKRTQMDTYRWPTEISAEMVSTALLKPDRMRTIDLYQYITHLEANGQSAQRYEIEFWRKVFYPISCIVMVVLALPFAYLHFRSGGIATYVFGGVMAGISFFLLNNVFGYIGNLQNWQPWLTAAAPGLIYSVLSLGAFGWLVLKR